MRYLAANNVKNARPIIKLLNYMNIN